MNKQTRKTYSAEFKVKVVLEAFKGQRTINELSSQYGIHPSQVNVWKKTSGGKFARRLLNAAGAGGGGRGSAQSAALPTNRTVVSRTRLAEKKVGLFG